MAERKPKGVATTPPPPRLDRGSRITVACSKTDMLIVKLYENEPIHAQGDLPVLAKTSPRRTESAPAGILKI